MKLLYKPIPCEYAIFFDTGRICSFYIDVQSQNHHEHHGHVHSDYKFCENLVPWGGLRVASEERVVVVVVEEEESGGRVYERKKCSCCDARRVASEEMDAPGREKDRRMGKIGKEKLVEESWVEECEKFVR